MKAIDLGELMNEKAIRPLLPDPASRRKMIVSGAAAIGSLAFGASGARAVAQQPMAETPSTGANKARTYLHQEVDFKATPQRIYEAILDSKQFAAFSGEPAEISREVGGAFTLFGGKIVGRNVELVPNQRIVQAWRPANWEPGDYTLVRFQLKPQGPRTTVVLDHTGFHEGDFDHFDAGWKMRYWEPLAKYLA